MKKIRLHVYIADGCPPCDYVKKHWFDKLRDRYELVIHNVTGSNLAAYVPYTPYFCILSGLNEVITLNSNSLQEIINDLEKHIPKGDNACSL
ncbi:MAG: hypothetical protein ACRDBG_08935 [Waterburya sp.]